MKNGRPATKVFYYVLISGFLLLTVMLVAKLVYLQIFHSEEGEEIIVNAVTSIKTVLPIRGTIYDRNGEILATNEEIADVCISAKYTQVSIIQAEEEIRQELLTKKNGKKYQEAVARIANNRTLWHQWVQEKSVLQEQMKTMTDTERKEAEAYIEAQEEELKAPAGSWTFQNGVTVEVWKDKTTGLVERDMPIDEMLAKALSEICGLDYATMLEHFSEKYITSDYYVVLKEIDDETKEKLNAFRSDMNVIYQVYFSYRYKRVYPNGTVACHVIGFMNGDGVGATGLEAYYEEILSGTSGTSAIARSSGRNKTRIPFDYENVISVENGKNIVTTIDLTVQIALEKQLKKTYEESKAGNRVTGIALDPSTGEVLAMATYPAYDCNDPYTLCAEFQQQLDDYATELFSLKALSPSSEEYQTLLKEKRSELLFTMWNNKAISETYEPGSTFKVITATMGFEEKVVEKDTLFSCYGSYTVEGWTKPISCHKKTGHGANQPFYWMLQQSCNPTMMQLVEKIGRSTFYNYLIAYGYDSKTGIDLPAESNSIISSYENFSKVSLAVYSFGQTFKVTPIRQLVGISAVANGGYLYTPHLLKEVTDTSGNVVQSYTVSPIRQVVSTETCDMLSWILEDGVSGDGGAKNAYVAGYHVAAKTGTSEKIDKDKETLRVGSTVAYAPYDNPKISALILCDEPMGESVYGSVVAAPYISNFLAAVLPYLGVESEVIERQIAIVRTYEGQPRANCDNDLNWRGITYEIRGDGDRVTQQIPAIGTQIYKDLGRIILYTGTETPKYNITMPDVTGITVSAAVTKLSNLGLNVMISGSASDESVPVVSQSITAGTKVTEGMSVEIVGKYEQTSD